MENVLPCDVVAGLTGLQSVVIHSVRGDRSLRRHTNTLTTHFKHHFHRMSPRPDESLASEINPFLGCSDREGTRAEADGFYKEEQKEPHMEEKEQILGAIGSNSVIILLSTC